MVKVKRRTKKENTVQNKDNKVIKKCVVKLRRLNNKSARKIDKTPLNTTQEESASALDGHSTASEDIFLPESAEIKSGKVKNCVVRMKNLPGTGISLRTKEVLKPSQVENLSVNPEPASRSPLEMVPERNFKTPVNKPRNVQLNVKKTNASKKIEEETNKNDVFEFSSQSSISEREDPTADVVQKLIETGRASVAKHLKGKGRPKTSRKRAAPKIATTNIKKNKNDEISKENPVKSRAKELPKQAQINVNTSPEIVNPIEKPIVAESDKSQQRTPVTDKRKLLEVARNFVKHSTPIRKQNIGQTDNACSPIPLKSPWRPLEEEHLPRTFYFSGNEDNLPSFSSDFIPSSQVIERSRKSILNHSDIENVNPSNEAGVNNNNNNNVRKTLGPRSPLKSINILEIINLPRKSVSDKSLIKPLLCNKLLSTTSKSPLKLRDETQQSHNIDPENFSIDNCFGFDEIIEDQEGEATPKIVPDKSRLMERLKNLQRLYPKTTPRKPQDKVRTIYPKVTKQKDIRDALTSTFQENENSTSTSNINFNNSADISAISREGNQNNSSIHLFDDVEDPMNFSESPALMRTYIRHPKKRRQSLYHSEEEEEEEVEEPVKKPKQTKADDKLHKELEKFVEEFNSMCDEVNQYELLVVKE